MPLRIDRLVVILAVATLFLPAFRIRAAALDLYLYYALLPFILILCVAAGSNLLSRGLALVLACLAAHTLLSLALLGNAPLAAAQQIVGITIICVVFHNVLHVNRFDVLSIFNVYMNFAKGAALIAIVQALSYSAGLRHGYDLGWLVPDYHQSYSGLGFPRIQSVFSEPSHFALMLSPAVFVSLLNLTTRASYFTGKAWSAAILLAAIFSFSGMAYLAILSCLALVGFSRGVLKRTLIACVVAVLAVLSYALVPEIQMRVDDTVAAFLYRDPVAKNLSTLTLYNNWHVALGNLADSHLLGGGLGSHPFAFERHSTVVSLTAIPFWHAALNAEDANSLLLRVLSELGIPGILGLFAFLACHYAGRTRPAAGLPDTSPELGNGAWIVSNASLAFIIMALVRHGHYFAFGTPFFLMLYCYSNSYERLAGLSRDASGPSQDEAYSTATPA